MLLRAICTELKRQPLPVKGCAFDAGNDRQDAGIGWNCHDNRDLRFCWRVRAAAAASEHCQQQAGEQGCTEPR
jgi:hypothetical protein